MKLGFYNRSHTTSKHIGPKCSTPGTEHYASEQNEALESNLASGDDSPTSLYMIYSKPGGIEFSDDLWMVDIPGV